MKMTVRMFLFLGIIFLASTVYAEPTLVFNGNILIGANGVSVNGVLYDVRFVDGDCATVFTVCDAAHFHFDDEEDAEEATDALKDLVFIDQGAHPLNSQPNLTLGCAGNSGSTQCEIWTPYEIQPGLIPGSTTPVPYIKFVNLRNSANPLFDTIYYGRQLPEHADLAQNDHSVWAVWTLSDPNAIPVTVQTNPSGLQITVDGVVATAPHTFTWIAGSAHTIGTVSPQGNQAFVNWNDGGPIAHSVSPTDGGSFTASFVTTIPLPAPDMTISKSHAGNFTQGQIGAAFSIVASNVGTLPTIGTVTVSNELSSGLIATSSNGDGWNCAQPAGPCSRNDILDPGLQYPAITLTVNVPGGSLSAANSATVSGGGEDNFANDTASDPTTILLPSPVQLVFNSDDILIGANRVLVGTTFYDVKFLDGTCAVAYGGACDEAHFAPFNDEDDAELASQALQVLVLNDQGTHPLNTHPDLTFGCPLNLGSTGCDIWTSFAIVLGSFADPLTPTPTVLYSNYHNDIDHQKDLVSYLDYPVDISNLDSGDHDNWAIWTLHVEPPPASGPIVKSSPSPAAVGVPRVPTLQWGTGGDATSYEYCIDTTGNNTCDTGWKTVAGTSVIVGGLNPSTTYYWQVRGRNSSGPIEADNGTWSSFTTTFSSPLNVAAAATGAVASASSSVNSNFLPTAAINGDRRGTSWGNGGGWNDGTGDQFPDWLQVDFAGPQTIDEIDVYTLQDDFDHPIEPFQGMTFTKYGVDEFQLQYWSGFSWVDIPGASISSSNQVWRQIGFLPLTTSKIRVVVTGAWANYSRLTEVEAYSDIDLGGSLPGPLTKIAPASAATAQPLALTLNWSSSSGATSYEYCIDTSNNNNCDTSWISAAGTSVPVNLNESTTYYWQVRASNAIGVVYADSGAWSSFATAFASRVNVAAAAKGATASASSSIFTNMYEPAGAINGDRKGLLWGNHGGWNDDTPDGYPDWLQVDFAGSQTIDEIDVFTVQDDYAHPVEPALGMPFTLYGLTAFQAQYWNGSTWITVSGGEITGNNQVWRQFVFAPVTTSRIRIFITGALAQYSRITEVEAYSGLHVGPGAFVKTSPANGAAGQSLVPTLSWSGSSDATGYEYCIDSTNNNACDSNWVSVTTGSSVTLGGLNAGTYYWQVRALNATSSTEANNGTWWSFTTDATVGNAAPNVASAANGATVVASSAYNAAFAAGGAIDGDRKGVAWGNNGGWNDATPGLFPDWLEIDFAGAKKISEIDVFTVQDNYAAPIEPTPAMTFTLYGITNFQLQYWNGTIWVDIPNGNISGNNLVWQRIAFPSVTTTSIRVNVTNALNSFSRITEVEAY